MSHARDTSDLLLGSIVRAHGRLARHELAGALAGLLEDLVAITASEAGFLGKVVANADGEPPCRDLAVAGAKWGEAEQGVVADVIRTGAPVLANRPARSSGDVDAQRACVGVPLHGDGQLVGVLGIAGRAGGYDLAMLRALEPLFETARSLIEAHADAERRLRADAIRHRNAEADALVLDMSTRLLEASGAEIDAALTECLGRVAVFLGANAASLHHRVRHERSVIRTHVWASPDVPMPPPDGVLLQARLELDAFPWALRRIEPGMRLLLRLEDLPPDAATERAAMAAVGIQATAWIASRAADTWTTIAVSWVGRPAAIAATELDRFAILADLFDAALRRRRDEASLHRHAETEALLLDLSGRFLELDPEQVDAEIERALGEIARFMGAQRATFNFAIDGGATIRRAHEWGAPITADPDAPAQFQRSHASHALPWVVRAVATGHAALVRDLAHPPEGAEELLASAAYGVRSQAWIPARTGGRIVGAISLCWLERRARIQQADLVPFSMAADLFAAVLRRRRAVVSLRRRAEIDALVVSISNRFLDVPVERVDAEIEAALGQLAAFSNADRVVLDVLLPDRPQLIRTHAFGVAVPPRLRSTGESSEMVPADTVRFAIERARAGASTGIVSIDDVPKEMPTHAVMTELGVRSAAWLVARVGDEPVGGILMMWMQSAVTIDRGDLTALAVVSDLLNAALRRKEAETALRESEERFRVMANSAPLIVWTTDATGRCAFVNETGLRLAGFARAGDPPEVWLDRIHPDDRDAARAAIATAVSRSGRFEFEARFLDESGQWRTLLTAGVPRFGVDGAVVGSVGTSSDITDRKRLEEDLRHAQKMEAVGRLAGGVAHDFNNILTAVIGHVEGAQFAVAADESPLRDLEGIEAAARRAGSLTNQLLAFSRRQIIEPRVVDVNELVGGVETLLRRLLGEHVLLDVALGSGVGCVRVDPGQIEQMLINLAANARDAMPDGGWLGIRTDRVSATAAPTAAAAAAPHEWVRIEIRDTGAGMDEKTLSRAFEPFFTTKEVGRGTGLGLATCYGIVQQNRGHISVESHPGSGTRFEILLPAVEPVADRGAARTAPARASGGSETILFVEDDPMVRSLAARALERAGYRVLAAADGEQARVLAEPAGDSIDLLITDLVMPRESGSGVAAWARDRWHGIPVLFISGYSAASPPGVADGEPGIGFLAKPFAPQDLIRRVRELLDG